MKILQELHNLLEIKSKDHDDSAFFLHGLWNVDLFFQPNIEERLFKYHLLVSQTQKQGCCYCTKKVNSAQLAKYIGQDVRKIQTTNPAIKIALLDAGYSALPSTPNEEFLLTGSSYKKAMERAEIVVDEVAYQFEGLNLSHKPRVLIIGVVGNIVKTLVERNFEVYATDLEEGLINQVIHGVEIQNGRQQSIALIEKVDLVLVTGMTLATNTLDLILEEARKFSKKTIIYAETGAWFGEAYCKHLGVDAVVSEPFPFYIFEGTTQILTYRADQYH
jgi:hypothetical protein